MRRTDWQERLAAFVRQREHMPFAWGANDCCSFAASAVEAVTGANPMAAVEPYADEFGAMRRVTRAGGMADLVTQFLGTPVSPLMAAVGDVVLVENAERGLLAVCNGTSVIAPGENGMVALDMNAAIAAWKI